MPAGVTDAITEVMISLCQALTENAFTYHIAWNDPDSGLCDLIEVADVNELGGAIPKLLSTGGFKNGISGISSYLQIVGRPKYSHIIYLSAALPAEITDFAKCGRTIAFICGEDVKTDAGGQFVVIPFTPNNYAQALFDLNLC